MMMPTSEVKLFSGSASTYLAEKIADYYGFPLGDITFSSFSDGEMHPVINESVRGSYVFFIQSTFAPAANLMELLLTIDAAKRASAGYITAVIPYFGYARQDRRVRSSRVPISAKVVADMMQKVGFSRLITVDLHADQIQGFFYMPVDNIYASITVLEGYDLLSKVANPVIVSPDVGGVVRARAIAKRLNDSDLAIIDKRRPGPNQAEVMNVIGNIDGRHCMIVDDIVDTAGTLCSAATALKRKGAATVSAYCTHPVFSGEAIANIDKSDIDQILVSDTIPLTSDAEQSAKIKQITLSTLIAETISRINHNESVSSMFLD